MKRWLFLITLAGLFFSPITRSETATNVAEVVFHGEELFKITPISSVSAEQRQESIVRRLKRYAKSPLIDTRNISVQHDDELSISVIMVGDEIILGVWEADAEFHDVPREKLSEHWSELIRKTLEQYRTDYTKENYIKGAIFSVIATLVFLLIWVLIRILVRKEISVVESKFTGQKKMLKVLDTDALITVNHNLIKFASGVLLLAVFIVYLNLVLSFFPWTYNLSAHLFELISRPFINFGKSFIDHLPNLFALGVIFFITSYFLRALKHLFMQLGEGKIRIRGFYQDWADTTFRLVRMVVIVFAAVVAFPFIPGSSSPAFKGISIFMGVLVSLGSSSAVGNIFGGLMLTYMRSFQPGDFVKINGMKGTVMASRTFSTRLKTPTNEIISIPNVAVASNHIINYSRMTKSIGVNIGTAVTIGYDVPWRKVHEQLLKSAIGVNDVLEDPAPTILQLSLDDFYVKYKLVISTKNPAGKFRILSDLHQNIQDNFAEAGIEIMSPHYQADRSGEQITIPDDMGIPGEADEAP